MPVVARPVPDGVERDLGGDLGAARLGEDQRDRCPVPAEQGEVDAVRGYDAPSGSGCPRVTIRGWPWNANDVSDAASSVMVMLDIMVRVLRFRPSGLPIMTCARPIFQGGYDAQDHQHLDPDPSLTLHRRVLPAPSEARRHQAGHLSDAPDHPFRRRRTRQFALRHLQGLRGVPDEVVASLYETLPDYHILKQRV